MNNIYGLIRILIDKLSLTLKETDPARQEVITEWLDFACESGEGKKLRFNNKSHKYWHTYSFPLTVSGTTKLIIQIQPIYYKKVPFIRLEWNPDKAGVKGNTRVQEICFNLCFSEGYSQVWEEAKITRMDLAIDVPGVAMHKIQVTANRIRKWGYFGDKKIQTKYLGAKGSEYYFRVYNKRTELIEVQNVNPDSLPKELTRFEVEYCPKKILTKFKDLLNLKVNPFDRLKVTNGMRISHYTDKWFISHCRKVGAMQALSEIDDPKTRKKYRDKLKASKSLQAKLKFEDMFQQFPEYIQSIGLFPLENNYYISYSDDATPLNSGMPEKTYEEIHGHPWSMLSPFAKP